MAQQSFRRLAVEEIAGEVARGAPAVGALDHEEVQVEDRARRARGNRGELRAAERDRSHEIPLVGEIDLEKRIAARVPARLQGLDQLLEGQLLVGDRFGDIVTHPLDQLTERWIAGEVGAQDDAVDEGADDRFQLRARPPRDRRADRDVLVSGVAAGDGLEGCQENVEHRRAVFP